MSPWIRSAIDDFLEEIDEDGDMPEGARQLIERAYVAGMRDSLSLARDLVNEEISALPSENNFQQEK